MKSRPKKVEYVLNLKRREFKLMGWNNNSRPPPHHLYEAKVTKRNYYKLPNFLILLSLSYFQVMQTHGFDPTEEDLKDMIRNVDTNANGAIDFNEFIEMMVKGRGHSVEDDVVHAFKVFDRDGDGLISEEELRLTMTNLGEALTEAEVRHMIAEADEDGDGKINFAEFSRLMAHNSGPGAGGASSGQSKGV